MCFHRRLSDGSALPGYGRIRAHRQYGPVLVGYHSAATAEPPQHARVINPPPPPSPPRSKAQMPAPRQPRTPRQDELRRRDISGRGGCARVAFACVGCSAGSRLDGRVIQIALGCDRGETPASCGRHGRWFRVLLSSISQAAGGHTVSCRRGTSSFPTALNLCTCPSVPLPHVPSSHLGISKFSLPVLLAPARSNVKSHSSTAHKQPPSLPVCHSIHPSQPSCSTSNPSRTLLLRHAVPQLSE